MKKIRVHIHIYTSTPSRSPYDLNNLECLYWHTESLSEHIQETNSNLLLHLNIQNLPTKFDNLVSFLNVLSCEDTSYLPLVLALSETWLTSANDSSFPISGFHQIISNIRQITLAGGSGTICTRRLQFYRTS